jgi:hypothetical protein
MRASIESLGSSLSRITPIHTGCVSALPQDETNDDDPAETQLHEVAANPDNDDEHKAKDDTKLPEGKYSRGRDVILTRITEDDQQEMLEYT